LSSSSYAEGIPDCPPVDGEADGMTEEAGHEEAGHEEAGHEEAGHEEAGHEDI
jgi:hypothetical protein